MGARVDRDAEDDRRKVRMKLAQCRSTCLAKFGTKAPWDSSLRHVECQGVSDCNMCWQVCDLFYKDFDLWGPMCGVDNICFPGCKVACSFHKTGSDGGTVNVAASLQPPRLQHDPVEDVVRVTWSPPRDSKGRPLVGALVYVVLLRGVLYQDRWQEIAQTSYLNASVSRSQLKQSSQLKLLAMGPEGPAAQTLSPVDLDAGSQGLLTQDDARGHGEPRTWTPRLVSLRWLRSSVEAMVTWDGASYRASDATPAKFEVMWKILDGSMDVTGRQYTSHDVATLTLWPEATYSVTVQRFGSSESPDSVSQALVIDTHGLQPEPRPLLQECPGCVRFEVVAGCAAALCLLVVACVGVLLVGKLRRSPRRHSQRPNSITVSTRGVKGVPEKAAHRLDMHSIKASSRLDFPGGCAVHEPMRHQVVQTSGPISPVGESREDLLDEDSSQSNYFVFDLNSSTCNAPRV